jgi:hypothetical protein
MNAYARMSLISEIAVKLQQEMSTTDINLLLAGYGIKNAGEHIVASKRVFVQTKLAEIPEGTVWTYPEFVDTRLSSILEG